MEIASWSLVLTASTNPKLNLLNLLLKNEFAKPLINLGKSIFQLSWLTPLIESNGQKES